MKIGSEMDRNPSLEALLRFKLIDCILCLDADLCERTAIQIKLAIIHRETSKRVVKFGATVQYYLVIFHNKWYL